MQESSNRDQLEPDPQGFQRPFASVDDEVLLHKRAGAKSIGSLKCTEIQGRTYTVTGHDLPLFAMLGNEQEADAEDLMQEVWVRRLENEQASVLLASGDNGRVCRNGHVILRNIRIDGWRRARSRPRHSALQEMEEEPEAPSSQSRELEGLVHEAASSIDPMYRRVLEMILFEGLKRAEVAHELGIPVGTVRTRLYRGLALLRGRLLGLAPSLLAEVG